MTATMSPEVTAEVPAFLLDPLHELIGWHREKVTIEARCVSLVAELISNGVHELLGYRSLTSLLTDRLGVSPREVAGTMRMARSLAAMPATRAAFESGELDVPRVRMLASARDDNPELFADHEEALVDSLGGLSMRDSGRAIEYWRQQAALEAVEADAAKQHDRRRLHVSVSAGMVYIDGVLDPVAGQTVITALDTITDAGNLDPEDTRTPAQRRADALTDMCHEQLSRIDRPFHGTERPHVMVHLSIDALEGRAGRPCELDDVGVITPEAARRLACDAKITRIITDGESQILDVGRTTRTVPAGIRKAVIARDRTCVIPGCGAPPRWCDVHHIVFWTDYGPTRVENCCLLCRRHHTMVHEGKVRLPQVLGGDPVLAGIRDRAPPGP